MLAKVARQILHQLIKLKEFFDSWVAYIQTGITKLSLGGIVWILPFPPMDEGRQTRKRVFIKIESFADFARR